MNKSIMILSVLLFSMVLCFNASAADWKEIDKTTYFDASRIVKTDKGTLLVSVKFRLSENTFKEKASIYNKSYNDYAYTMQDVELNCDSSQSGFKPIHHYDITGIFTMFSTDKDAFTTAAPGSTGEFNPANICNYAKKWHI